MTAICFVCNLPILSHQVGLVWQGGNGWDDLVREQLEESTIRQRLGGRRDSATQICSISPPTETQETSPPPSGNTRRRRSSLAQLTDILREWGGGSTKSRQKAPLNRRETLADLARSLPWGRQTTTEIGPTPTFSTRKRRESSADSGIKSGASKSRRDSHQTAVSDFRSEVAKLWQRRESNAATTVITPSSGSRRGSGESSRSGRRDSITQSHGAPAGTSRRGSGESGRSGRRDSTTINTPPPPKVIGATHKKRRDSRTISETPSYYRQDQRPSTSSTASDSVPVYGLQICTSTVTYNSLSAPTTATIGTDAQAMQPPTIIMSSVTPPATSPTVQATTPTHPLLATRRDSTTQCGRLGRRDSRSHASPERATNKFSRLQRQSTTYDESCLPGGNNRRGSQPGALSPDVDESGRKARRDSLSPDSASRGRRDSRSHLSPDRSGERDISPVRRHRRGRLRRQSTSVAGRRRGHRSPDSSSCSSRDPSPSGRPAPPPAESHRPTIRRQSTTEEILIARGFRRQSTTEEMIRCRNFRRQSSQSDDTCRYRGRRDSCTQILDGTIASMTVETTSTFFDSSTQTEPSPLYDNHHYHEECLRCNSCGLNLTGPNQKRARRFKNQILCDLHFADVALMECSDFMQQLRSFKPQSLGCAVARRKSSTTLIFPLPPQACSDISSTLSEPLMPITPTPHTPMPHTNIILKELKSIKYDLKIMKQQLSALETKIDIMNEKHATIPTLRTCKFKLPITDDEELSRIEESMQSGENKNELRKILSLVGGDSTRQNVNNILKKTLSKEMALKYSLKGKQKKRAFGKLTLYEIVLDAVRATFVDATDKDIDKYIAFALAGAGDRNGGRKDREQETPNENV